MLRIPFALPRTFRSLSVRNYRLYFFGQLISASGSWMQAVAQDWLVLELTHEALPVGLTIGAQFLPMLLFGLWSGALADRFNKRKLLIAAQTLMAALALLLGVLTYTGLVELWMIYVLAFLLGCGNAVDNPTRQALLGEMVGREQTPNAIALNGAVFNSARVIGPALAGVVIASVGLSAAFFLNAASFVAVLAALFALREREYLGGVTRPAEAVRVTDGLRYVWRTRPLRKTLLLLAIIATLGLNFRTLLPLLTRFAFHGDARECGFLASLFAIGSVAGALLSASRARPDRALLAGSAGAFGLLSLLAAGAPSLAWLGALLTLIGAASILFLSTCNALVQLGTPPAMRGRVMSLYALIFLGSTPLGALIVGSCAEAFGPRSGLLLAGGAGLCAAALAVAELRRTRDEEPADRRAPMESTTASAVTEG